MYRVASVLFLVLSLVLVPACTDNDLLTVSKALNDTASAVGVIQSTAIAANQQKTLSDDATSQLLTLTVKITTAGQQASAVTRKLSTLAPADKAKLLSILTPIIAAVSQAPQIQSADPKVQQQIQAALLLISTSLNSVQLVLAAK